MASSVSEGPVLHRAQGAGHIVELNRPRALNALSWEMVKIMHPLYEQLEQAAETRVVVLRGNGGKAFCAGGDVVDITTGGADRVHFFRDEYKLIYGIATMRTPHVAIIDGITMGGGAGISINGRYRVCTERSLLAMPEATIGFFCDVGGSHFLPRLKPGFRGVALHMGLSAGRLSGADIYHVGLATHYVHSSKLEALVAALCDASNYAPSSSADDDHRVVADVLAHYAASEPLPAYSQPPELLAVIADVFSQQSVDDVVLRLTELAHSGRADKPHHDWAVATLKKIMAHSPTSLHVIFEQIKQGAHWDLAHALRQEYNIAQAYMSRTLTADFIEGVRAVLVDKDHSPKWNPAHLGNDISHAYVRKFFDFDQERLELAPFAARTRL